LEQKAAMLRARELEKALKEETQRQKEELKARQEANKKKREENSRKTEVVQLVSSWNLIHNSCLKLQQMSNKYWC
jgi:hypothetical protein